MTTGASMNTETNRYHCKACGKTVTRRSSKRWILSLCEAVGRVTRLYRVAEPRHKTKPRKPSHNTP